jgi:small-conductance mechanosensitive channel
VKSETTVQIQQWSADLMEAVGRLAIRVLEYLPSILGALVLLLVGWGIARLFRYGTEQISERLLQRLAHSRPMDTRVQQPSPYRAAPAVAGRIVFWVVLLFFAVAALDVLELQALSQLLGQLTGYLPQLITGILILVAGLWVAEFSRVVLVRNGNRAGIEHSETLGRVGHLLVMVVVIAIAVGQIGIDNTLLVALVIILVGSVLGALGLSFALGARATVGNLLAVHTILQGYQVGDHIRLDDVEGQIIEITRTSVLIETSQGKMMIPARHFNKKVSMLINRRDET